VKKLLEKLRLRKPTVQLPNRLRSWSEEDHLIFQVRSMLQRARDFYVKRGRKILATDLQAHLDFFDDAIRFDRLENSAVLLPTDRNRN
jgi:hypothetical protein